MGANTSASGRPLLPIPANLNPQFACFCLELPDDPAYIQMLAGKIKELATWTSYQYAGNPGDRTLLVGIWERVLAQLGDAMCCCDQTNAILQFQIQNIFQNWSSVTNNTDINIYAPVTTFTSTAGESAPELAARVDALCFAVGAMVDIMCDVTINVLNQQINLGYLLSALAAAVTAILSYMSVGVFYILGAGIISAALAGASALAGLVSIPQLQNLDARRELKCALRTALADLAPTEANLWAAVDGLTGLSTDASAILSLMTLLHTREKDSKEIFQGFINALGEAQPLALAGLLPPCDCSDCFLYPSGDWTVLLGTDVAGEIQATSTGYKVRFDIGSSRVVNAVTWQDQSQADNWNGHWHVQYYSGATLVRDHTLYNQATDHYTWFNYNSDSDLLSCDRVEIMCDASVATCAPMQARDFRVCVL